MRCNKREKEDAYNDATGLWSLGSLATNTSATLTITSTVAAGTAGQIITNRVNVATVS